MKIYCDSASGGLCFWEQSPESSFLWCDSTRFQKGRTGHGSGPDSSPALASRVMLCTLHPSTVMGLHRNPRLTQGIIMPSSSSKQEQNQNLNPRQSGPKSQALFPMRNDTGTFSWFMPHEQPLPITLLPQPRLPQ